MEKVILLLSILVISLSGCNNIKKTTDSRSGLELAIYNAENSTEIIKTVFLQFELGVSHEQTCLHLDSLRHTGKIYTSDEYGPTYDFHTEHGTIICSMGFDYFDNKLCGVFLYPQYNKDHSGYNESAFLLINLLLDEYQKKFTDYQFEINDKNKEQPTYCLIKDNQVIEFSSEPKGRIYYYNAPQVKMRREQEKTIKTEKLSSTQSDL